MLSISMLPYNTHPEGGWAEGSGDSWGAFLDVSSSTSFIKMSIWSWETWAGLFKEKIIALSSLFLPILFQYLSLVLSLLRWALDRSSVLVCVGGNSLVTWPAEKHAPGLHGWLKHAMHLNNKCFPNILTFCPSSSLLQQPPPAFLFQRDTSSLFYHVKLWQPETWNILENIWRVHYLVHSMAQTTLIISIVKQAMKRCVRVCTGEGGNEMRDPHWPFCNTSSPYIVVMEACCGRLAKSIKQSFSKLQTQGIRS